MLAQGQYQYLQSYSVNNGVLKIRKALQKADVFLSSPSKLLVWCSMKASRYAINNYPKHIFSSPEPKAQFELL